MNSDPPSRDPEHAPVSKAALIVMAVILVTMALVAAYANFQRLRQNKIETVTVTPIATPTPTPSLSSR